MNCLPLGRLIEAQLYRQVSWDQVAILWSDFWLIDPPKAPKGSGKEVPRRCQDSEKESLQNNSLSSLCVWQHISSLKRKINNIVPEMKLLYFLYSHFLATLLALPVWEVLGNYQLIRPERSKE